MSLITLLAAAATAAVAPQQAPAPELWRGAWVNMPIQQVQEMFSKGHPGGGPPLENGATQGWATGENVYGQPGLAGFYFRGGLLDSVIVELNDMKPRSTAENMKTARTLETGMEGYYGKPTRCIESTRRGLDRLDCAWEVRGVDVGLSYQDFGGASPDLNVAIRALKARPPHAGARFHAKGQHGG